MTKIFNLLKGYASIPVTINPNYLKIPCTLLTPTEENSRTFNNILAECKKEIADKIVRTPSGGICTDWSVLRLPAFDYLTTPGGAEITILIEEGMWRIQFRPGIYEHENIRLSGRKAFMLFHEMLKKDYGIDIENYAIENGDEIKKKIEPPLVKLESEVFKDIIFDGVHHIDFHSSYGAGLANTYPEFRPLLQKCFEKRKENKAYKALLNFTIGFMQSKWTGFRFAQLSKAAIDDNNIRVKKLAKNLEESGRVVILYNTDGIWYSGKVYHGDGEGIGLGEWTNDHTNCKFRAKSDGCYEFIENGVYYPVVRGYTNLDKIKDRSNWEWGDIYKQVPVYYYLTEEGVKYVEAKEK